MPATSLETRPSDLAGGVPRMAPKNLAILVHDDVEVLDFCGPFEAFGVSGDEGPAHVNVFT